MALIVVAWLTAGAMAVRAVSRIWLRHWAERRLRGSSAAVTYLERPGRLLSAAAMGIAATLLVAGMMVGSTVPGPAIVGVLIPFAAVVIVLGQLVPRAIALRWPSLLAPIVLPVLQVTASATGPLSRIGAWLVRPLTRDVAVQPESERDTIQDLLREGELEGVGERGEIANISGVEEFTGKRVSQIMTPRADIFALPEGSEPLTLARSVAQVRFSRVPIYRQSLDDAFGMIHVFDVFKAQGERIPRIRPVALAAADAPCNELLFRMLRDRVHLALVRDAASKVVGLVSLEDLLEELVGDIRDEHDEPELPGEEGAA
jgi:putative hemolysin